MKLNFIKNSVPAAVALLVTGLMFPYPAYAVGRDVGQLIVDCDIGDLDRESIVYLEVGDTFTIENTSDVEECLIEDPNNILTGEDDDLGSGPGVLSNSWDAYFLSDPITIDGPGTFTISEDAGSGSAGARTVTFRVTTGILFASPSGVGEYAVVDDVYDYEEVFLIGGTTVVDATVTINEIENLENDEFNLDGGYRDARGGLGSSIDPDDSNLEGFAEFTIAFHAAGDPSTSITLSDISLTVKDIDSQQYVAAENVDSYSLSASPATQLSARTVGSTLFLEELDGDSSSTEDEDHWAVLNFNSASTITIRLGSRDGSGASFNTLFTAAEWSSAPATISTAPALAAPAPAAPASTTPKLAATGANVEWLLVTGLLAVITGSGFLSASRRRRI